MAGFDDSYPLTMQEMSLHDPFVLVDRERGLYCLYQANYGTGGKNSGDSRRVLLYLTRDMRHFSRPQSVLDRDDYPSGTWFEDCDSPWAPEVHYFGGAYWMFLTMHKDLAAPVPPTAGPAWFVRSSPIRRGRGMALAVADKPEGPFRLLPAVTPLTGSDRLALDGTLVIDGAGDPWLVYAHEWVQIYDGAMEAVRLDREDLSRPLGAPIHLWYASQAPWYQEDGDAPLGGWNGDFEDYERRTLQLRGHHPVSGYVTDGPWVIPNGQGGLICLWTSYQRGVYTLTQAISRSGKVQGPWEQLESLDGHDAGHAMVFEGLDGERLLIMHTNMTRKDPAGRPMSPRGVVYRVNIGEGGLRLDEHRSDLDGVVDPAAGR